jgi:hypothetical protein
MRIAMAQGSSSGGWLKWLVGVTVSLLAAGSGIVALLTYFNINPFVNNAQGKATAVVCHIAGQVYTDNNKPVPNVEIRYVRTTTTGETQDQTNARSRLATTNTNGGFDADCSFVEPGNFPLRLVLSSPNWSQAVTTDEYVNLGQQRNQINMYVSGKTVK